ncbi:MAG: ABC transporter substrate-binding protein [Blautia massiliensis (ex Durand et al. 2017)]
MKKRLYSSLCAGMILTAALAGCSAPASSAASGSSSTSGSSSAETASSETGEKTTLNVLWWGSQTRNDQTTKLIEKFEELNPDIDVVADFSDWDGYWTKLPAQVAGGQTPDVFQMDYAYLAQYVENGVLAELDSYVADGSLDLSGVSQSVKDSGTVNGKFYAVSTGTNAPVMLYRNDILEELGLELPMNPTLTQYMDVAKAVYEATGMRDTFITGCTAANLNFYLRNYGMNFYNDEDNGLGFDDPQYLVDMWELALQAQNEGWGMKPGEETAVTAFDSMVNDAWSRQQNSNELQAYRDATGKDIRMVMVPTVEGATTPNSYLKPAMYWCVGADSPVKEAAVRFIDFFTNSTDCYDIVGIERAVPIDEEMRAYVAPNLDEVSQEVVDFIDYVSQPGMTSPIMNPDPPVSTEVEELLDQYSERVRYGETTDLEGAATEFMAEANKILAEASTATAE